MPQETPDSRPISAALARKAADGASAEVIAATVITAFVAIEASLTPIIGAGGVVAMYHRSLLRVGSSRPWLSGGDSTRTRTQIDVAGLRSSLAERAVADAADAGGALLQTFCDLLASLIGASLTERLLRDVWADL